MPTPFTDIDHLPDDAKKAIEWAREAGITNGTSETTFAPDQPITRWQMALMLYRFSGYMLLSGRRR